MINRRHMMHGFQRSMTRVARMARSAAVTASVFVVAIAAPRVEAQQQAPVRVPAAVLERYVGEYVYPDGESTWVVSRSGDTLFHLSSNQRFDYVPISETKFAVGTVVTAEFFIDEAGGVTQILSDGVGLAYRLRRKGSPPEHPAALAAALPPAVRVPKSVLRRYVGTYEYLPGQMSRTDLTVVIRLEGDKLIREGAGPTVILTPISETRFMAGNDPSFVVEFVIDDAGVTQIMGLGYQQMVVRRTSKR